MEELILSFNIWIYLAQVGPVALVMGIAVVTLWRKNEQLIADMKRKDEANLLTLENIRIALGDVKGAGIDHTDQLKKHIDDRIDTLKEIIRK